MTAGAGSTGGSLRAGSWSFAWGGGLRPHLMAIVNATPDSFSDGGLHASPEQAIAFAEACAGDGASILDVGGESTRPGAGRVPADEQRARTEPVVRALARRHAVSIDTTRAEVAAAALAAGACMVNDVSGATEDPAMLATVAASDAAIVLMHRRFAPDQDRWSTDRDDRRPAGDVVREVRDWLGARVEAAVRAGLARDRIAVDPGFGFGKDVEQNLAMLASLAEFGAFGVPVLAGLSRKSFLGAIAGRPDPAERDAASIGAALAAAARGAAILRVHAVRPHADALAAWGMPRAACAKK